jgi:hypothetical protein
LLNHNDLLGFHYFCLNLLLLARLEIARTLRLRSHALHSIHRLRLLRQESIPEVRGPLDVIRQALNRIGKRGHGLYTGIPGLLLHGIDERFVFQTLVFL